MAESIVSAFVNKLGPLIAEEGTFLLGVEGQLMLFRDELEWVRSFLKEAESKRRTSHFMEVWVTQIIDLAYDAEDVIDTYILCVDQQKRRNFVKKLLCFGNKVKTLHQLGKRIDQINTRAQRISACRLNYNLDVSQPLHESSFHRAESLAWRRRGISTLEESDVVGLKKESAQLIDWLKDNEAFPSRKIISIVGMGGLGKTALARVTFNNVSNHFDAKMWITVSQEYKVRDLLLGALKEFRGDSSPFKEMEDEELERELHKQLEPKRYLVVIDDIWNVEAWDRINRAFPNNEKGSRILLITRIKQVALQVDPSSRTHLEPGLLSKDESWELFCKKVFDTNCPKHLAELGKEIVNQCGGLPLAILVMGGLLMGKESTVSAWCEVLESATWHLSQDSNRCREILSLSYSDLPYYLKSCFLYLGLFPEDSRIDAQRLVLLWVAEGFIQARGEEKMEDVAKDCLEELALRSMIQVTERVYYGGPVGVCRVHDLLRELAILEGQKNGFMDIQTTNTSISTHNTMRRIAIHSNINNEDHTSATITPKLRSLLDFTSGSDKFWKSTPLHGAKMLRVLDLCDVPNLTTLPKEIGNLILLRYLRLRFTKVRSLPTSIGKLLNLQTLYLISNGDLRLPKALWKLKNIRHFFARSGIKFFENSMHPGNTKSLHREYLGKNLLTLAVRGDVYTCLSSVLVKARCLQWLELEGKLSIPSHQSLKNYFPSSLTDLRLIHSGFEQDPSNVLGSLPKLKTLSLQGICRGSELVFSSGLFPQLQFLHISLNRNLIDWRVEDGAVSNLRHVCITGCEQLKKLPDGLKNVRTLQKLELFFMPASFTVRVKENGEDWESIKHVPIITVGNL